MSDNERKITAISYCKGAGKAVTMSKDTLNLCDDKDCVRCTRVREYVTDWLVMDDLASIACGGLIPFVTKRLSENSSKNND